MGFEFNFLGPVEVLYNGRPVRIKAPKQRALLVALLVDLNRDVPVSTLISRVWGDDPPECAHKTLQNYVLRLRRVLRGTGEVGGPLATRAAGYQLTLAEDACDLNRFDRHVSEARSLLAAAEIDRASACLRAALALWRSQPLDDVPSEQLRREVLPGLVERRLNALELRIEVDLMLGRHVDVLPELCELTETYPLRERFWKQRILALYRAGRQGEALECHRRVRTLLADELGVLPGAELSELLQQILVTDPALTENVVVPAQRRSGGNLVVESSAFIGRSAELAHALTMLGAHRLVTFTGVGGVGKSRLARRAAELRAEAYADGVWVVDLADATECGHISGLVAETVGCTPVDGAPGDRAVVERLRGMRALLLLDNCEHVIGGVSALVTLLLGELPDLRIAVTSRQRVGLRGEQVMRVAPMALPDERTAESQPRGCDSVELFVDRARSVALDLQFTPGHLRTVARLCRRLEGLPLAIELAAMRLNVLSPEELAERLDDGFRLLNYASDRTRSLAATVEHSWNLCTERERQLWLRLSSAPAAFDLAVVETACAADQVDDSEMMDLLAGLVDKSVLLADTSGSRTTYRMLLPFRHHGRRLIDAVVT